MRVTQQQIAEKAGVSRGTVYRALNGNSNINPEVSARIKQIALELGYKPSAAAISLVRSQNPLKIGVIIQSAETPFMQDLCQHILDNVQRYDEMGIQILLRTHPGVDLIQQMEQIEELEQAGIHGLIISPIDDERIHYKLNHLIKQNIPVITVNTDMPSTRRMCYIGQDHIQSGRACAGLMKTLVCGNGKILILTGNQNNLSLQERVSAFRTEVLHNFPQLTLLPLELCHDNPKIAYDITKRVLTEHPDLAGIYISASGQSSVCQAVKDMGKKDQIRIIVHDLIQSNIDHLKEHVIDFIIDQDANRQATLSLSTMADYLLRGQTPPQTDMLIHIRYINRYNIPSS